MQIAVLNLKNALVILQSLNCYGSSNDQLDCVNTKGFCLLSFFVSNHEKKATYVQLYFFDKLRMAHLSFSIELFSVIMLCFALFFKYVMSVLNSNLRWIIANG